MRWLMDVCPNSLGWQTWLILCAVVVVLWAVAIAGAAALFTGSRRPRRSERPATWLPPVGTGHGGAD